MRIAADQGGGDPREAQEKDNGLCLMVGCWTKG